MDRIPRLAETRIQARVGNVLVGGGKVADRVALGVDHVSQDKADAQGRQRRIQFLDAPLEFFLDGGNLPLESVEVVEDRAELVFRDMLGLAGADRGPGGLQEALDGFGIELAAADVGEDLADFGLSRDEWVVSGFA